MTLLMWEIRTSCLEMVHHTPKVAHNAIYLRRCTIMCGVYSGTPPKEISKKGTALQ